MRSELSVVPGLLDGFRVERDRALADLAAQMVQADAEADVAEALDRAGEGQGRLRRALAGLGGAGDPFRMCYAKTAAVTNRTPPDQRG